MSVNTVAVGNLGSVDVAAAVALIPNGFATSGTLVLVACLEAISPHLLGVAILRVDFDDARILVFTIRKDTKAVLTVELLTLVAVVSSGTEHNGVLVLRADQLSVELLLVEELPLGLEELDLVCELILEVEDLSVFLQDIVAGALGLAVLGFVPCLLPDVGGLGDNVLKDVADREESSRPVRADVQSTLSHDTLTAGSTTFADLGHLTDHSGGVSLNLTSDLVSSCEDSLRV